MKIVATQDNSSTIYLPELDEHYHSTHGAIQESKHVFIQEGLFFLTKHGKTEISIFEVGFGTGLNALLSLIEAGKSGLHITYYALEKTPVSPELIWQLNYPEMLGAEGEEFREIHESPWQEAVPITPHFTLFKIKGTLQDYEASMPVDLVFYDAFGPRAQQEMWTAELLQKTVSWLTPKGVWVSYCAKGQVKRDLKAAGLVVESIPGPPGKREMTRGQKH